jgi:hypothetical protein
MDLRTLPWGKIALAAGVLLLMATPTADFPDKWALARQLHPGVQPQFMGLLKAIEARGYRIELTSCYRAGGDDPHGYGLALDLNLVHVATGQRYGASVGLTKKADWEATGIPALIRSMGFRWGGDFVTPWKDLKGNLHIPYDPVHVDFCNHYQPSKLKPIALKMALKAKKTLATYDKRLVPLAA